MSEWEEVERERVSEGDDLLCSPVAHAALSSDGSVTRSRHAP